MAGARLEAEVDTQEEVAKTMLIERDVPIEMDDGIVLRADVFRPNDKLAHPALMTYGPYGKGLAFADGYPTAWKKMTEEHPDTVTGSTNVHQCWEVADPEKWVPHGYVIVRVDSRGAGRSPGFLDPFSARETEDFRECIEWAGRQEWSNGKVGLNGISYYGMNQWRVAALKPGPLAAICVWEGASDFYREGARHGGILSEMLLNWYEMQVLSVQHGRGEAGPRSAATGELVCGDQTLSESELAANRADLPKFHRDNEFIDAYRERLADLSHIDVPLLSAGNWGGQGLHLRGNIEGFCRASSTHKWLEIHDGEHWVEFYTDYGVDLQRRFFDHFLKGEDNRWDEQPRIQMKVRHVDGTTEVRHEDAWPLPGTNWTDLQLDIDRMHPGTATESVVSFDANGEGISWTTEPMAETTEITGPVTCRLFVSTTSTDADIFAVLRAFDPAGNEHVFQGAIDPFSAVTKGWLRMSHRETDERLSTPYRPFHSHERASEVIPYEIYQLDVELWPTSVVLPPGWRLSLTLRGSDWVYGAAPETRLSNFKNPMQGSGPFLHNDPSDRPASVFGGRTSIHLGGTHTSFLRLPTVPAARTWTVPSGSSASEGRGEEE